MSRSKEDARAMARERMRRWREKNPERARGACRRYFAKVGGFAPPDPAGPTLPELLDRQAGLCAICDRELSGTTPVLDHCHDTGRIRGALCRPCNCVLSVFQDLPERFSRAAAYLEVK